MPVETIAKQSRRFVPTSISVVLFPAKTKACGLLDSLAKQEPIGMERTQAVNENKYAKQIEDSFAKAVKWKKDGWRASNNYKQCRKFAASRKYSSADIYAFSLQLAKFQDEEFFHDWAGIFLSALINTSKDKEIRVCTSHLESEISALGFLNHKDIVVEGNGGSHLGIFMWKGSIIVNSTSNCIGRYMRGGKITVNGDGGEVVGCDLKGGEIWVNGNIISLSDLIDGGNVFQRGRLIVKDGERIGRLRNK